jgi:hypothetical protein
MAHRCKQHKVRDSAMLGVSVLIVEPWFHDYLPLGIF